MSGPVAATRAASPSARMTGAATSGMIVVTTAATRRLHGQRRIAAVRNPMMVRMMAGTVRCPNS